MTGLRRSGAAHGAVPGTSRSAVSNAFRPDPSAPRASGPSRRQALALLAVLVVVAGTIAVASIAVKPSRARAFELFYGSVFIDDDTAPVAVDLATGKPSVRLTNAYTQVAAKVSGDLDVVPLDGGTLLLDSATGEFNMLDSGGFVLKHGGGVSLPDAGATTSATAIAAGSSAYIVRTSATATSAYLVGAATVGAAADGGGARARASVSMPVSAPVTGSTAVSANRTGSASTNSDLWLLTGVGSTRTIRQLVVPPDSDPGATLSVRDHGTVRGVAAIAVSSLEQPTAGAGTGADGGDGTGGPTGPQRVAVASASGVEVFDGTGAARTVRLDLPSGVDRILPATNQQGSFQFLYHLPSGWRLVGVDDTAGPASVVALPHLTGVDLATPAQSNGALYTMDRRTGHLWRIALSAPAGGGARAQPLPGAGSYPLVAGESAAFSQATVLARDTRVIFNSRSSLEALTAFTDGSHAPVVIDKRTAVSLAANGAEALAALHTPPEGGSSSSPQSGSTPTPPPAQSVADQPVTDKIDCRTTTQIPHIPSVQLVARGSRSVQLSWTYPLLDRQDCAPSTYTVSTQVAAGQAPRPPGTVTVNGSTGAIITGLFPDTQYRFVVSAFLNGKQTPSAPLLVRTQPEGPAAPTGLRVSTDDAGNWQLSWNSCGGSAAGCVPVDSWTITPQVCDSTHGLVNAPASANLTGDPTAHSFGYVYRGGAGLLGSGLRFTVAGVGDGGIVGDTATSGDCAHSWAHPVADDITVHASTPPRTAAGGTSSTTATVTFTGSPDVALGGAGGTLTYRLLSGGSVVATEGPTTATTASLPGIKPGSTYQVQVVVTPPGHPEAALTLDPVPVQAAVANWPAFTVSAAFSASTGALALAFTGLSSAAARGESFDLSNSQLVCGNTAMPLTATRYDPAQPLTVGSVDRAQFNGNCVAQVAFVENPATILDPAYFGGTVSPRVSSNTVSIPVPPLPTSAGDFTAAWARGGSTIAVSYSGQAGPALTRYASGWSIQAQYRDPAGTSWTPCGAAASQNLAQGPATLDVSSCYAAHYQASWQVTVTFGYFGQSPTPPYAVAVSGSAPQPVDLSTIAFSAAWSGSSIAVGYTGTADPSVLGRLQWSETVSSDLSGTCNSASQTPTGADPAMVLAVDLTACPPTGPVAPPPTEPGGGGGPTAPPTDSGSASHTPDADGATPLPADDPSGSDTGGGSSTTPPPTRSASYTVTIVATDPTFGTSRTYTVAVSGAPS